MRFAVFSMISFILVAVIKMFLGNSIVNLKQLEAKAGGILHEPLVSSAKADFPEPPPSLCSCCGGSGGGGS